LNTTALAFKCDSNKKKPFIIKLEINYFFYKRLSPVFSNFVLRTLTAGCQCIINCYIGRFLWALPKPAIFEKLSKLFCFLEDNLALSKFQCSTDTPPNNNLPQLLIKNQNFYIKMRAYFWYARKIRI